MDPRHLALLRELGDRGSVTAVAAALFITPSAVSQQLAALQRHIPVPLTQLRGRTLVLTDAGQALAAAATDVATALARADRAVEAFLLDPHATVRIAAFHSAAAAFFPALLEAAAGGGPVIECTDQDVTQAQFPGLTADHDIVIAHRSNNSPPWPKTTSVTPLLNEPLDVALPTGHRLASLASLSVSEVSTEPWIVVHEGFPLTGSVQAIEAAADRRLRVVHHINDFFVAAGLVAAGGGIALLPRYTTPSRTGIVLRPLRDLRTGRQVDALVRPERALRSSVTAVLAMLRQIADELARATAAPGP
jgi:DNA-binding transcriptional LysR family regulator